MDDPKVYRWTGISALASIAVFFIEFPFYLVRTGFPGLTDPVKFANFTATYGTNVMTCVSLDFIILALIMIFLAGFRHLVRQADPQQEWLGTLVFGVGLVYVTLTLVADSLQAATVVDARTVPANGVIMRGMFESMFLTYGSVALFPDGGCSWPSADTPAWPAGHCRMDWLGRLSLCAGMLSVCSVHVCWPSRPHAVLQSRGMGFDGHRLRLPPCGLDDSGRYSDDPAGQAGTPFYDCVGVGAIDESIPIARVDAVEVRRIENNRLGVRRLCGAAWYGTWLFRNASGKRPASKHKDPGGKSVRTSFPFRPRTRCNSRSKLPFNGLPCDDRRALHHYLVSGVHSEEGRRTSLTSALCYAFPRWWWVRADVAFDPSLDRRSGN